jgi:hypothetical protein
MLAGRTPESLAALGGIGVGGVGVGGVGAAAGDAAVALCSTAAFPAEEPAATLLRASPAESRALSTE